MADRKLLMVVVGAGASFDSIPQRDLPPGYFPNRNGPPLASDLFAPRFTQLLQGYERASPLIAEIRPRVLAGENVEDILQAYLERADAGEPYLRRQLLAVRWYLHDLVRDTSKTWLGLSQGTTNYGALVNILMRRAHARSEDVLFVSFNYDHLLEDALRRVVGFEPTIIENYMSVPPAFLFKPHGSVGWVRDTNLPLEVDTPAEIIEHAEEIESTGEVVLQGAVPTGKARIPAIAIPTHSKNAFECPAQHVELFVAVLSRVNRALTIGWHGQEKAFIDLVRVGGRLAHTTIVTESGEQSLEVLGNIGGMSGGSHATKVEGFTALVEGETVLRGLLG